MKKKRILILSTLVLVMIMSVTLFSCGGSTYKANDSEGREITANVGNKADKVTFTYYAPFEKKDANGKLFKKDGAKFKITSEITDNLKNISFEVEKSTYTVKKINDGYLVEKNGNEVNDVIKQQAISVFEMCEGIKLSEDKKQLSVGDNIYILK